MQGTNTVPGGILGQYTPTTGELSAQYRIGM
jgi:hypothetical protein